MNFSFARMRAFMLKEIIQVWRDPSSILIAFILPLLMIFLFAFGVSLDTNVIRIGLVQEDFGASARSLAAAFENTPYFKVDIETHRTDLTERLMKSELRGIIVIPQDFSARLARNEPTHIQAIADGSETNTASFFQNYAEGVVMNWQQNRQNEWVVDNPQAITSVPRVWFNPELKSRNVILPGSIAVIMALIGTLLTALVVAREWERGSMEAILATPIHIGELILGKLIPYFLLGMGSMFLCTFLAVFAFHVPFQGSILILSLGTALFLLAGLSQGLLISTLAKNQFVASQVAMNAAFLPAFMLSGFLYEIQSMPLPLQWLTYIFPPRYFVSIIQTSFLSDVIWARLLPDLLALLAIGCFFFCLVTQKSKKSLE